MGKRAVAAPPGPPQEAIAYAPSFPIVGIGASAGGLEACTQLLRELPAKPGMAFVLVQHLDPVHESILPELLARASKLPVLRVTEGMSVEPNHLYVIPPNVDLTIVRGALQLTPRSDVRSLHMPIDRFFRSLAEDQGRHAIGVILSGTASDGSMGIEAIKAEAGIVLVQDENSAKYTGMPHSAIATGCVDFIVPPKGIAKELTRLGRHPYVATPQALTTEEGRPTWELELLKLFRILRLATGVDFAEYKRQTINRRIQRRMAVHKIDALKDYVRTLREHEAEVKALYQEFLITVTSFFRDPEAFAALQQQVFPSLLKMRGSGEPWRIWVPGCSSGEEAYSLAICLREFLGDKPAASGPIQIFATDVSESALEKARMGFYLENITLDVSPERLRYFFTKAERGYQVNKALREVCVFAKHDILRDPPFGKLDLISFRNVLIYFGPALQKKLVPLFHYALKPDGFLLLGSSETIGSFSELFRVVDRKYKVYARVAAATRQPLEFARGPQPLKEPTPARPPREAPAAIATDADLQKEADRLVMRQYAPSGVLVNQALEILQFRGETSPYLAPAPGRASLNLSTMAREGVLMAVTTAIREAKKTGDAVVKEGVVVGAQGQSHAVNVKVIPLKLTVRAAGEHYVVLFEEAPRTGRLSRVRAGAIKPQPLKRQTAQLQQELTAAKEFLRVRTEEQEAINEELKAANEEILSSNEELQSTNEELETSKEELQSTNEELTTVNEELENRTVELVKLANDLNNLMNSVILPVVMLDHALRIRRITPMAEKVLHLLPVDIGRSVGDVKIPFEGVELEPLITQVVGTGIPIEREVQDRAGSWYILWVRPYRTTEGQTVGAVLSLLDITEQKRSQAELKLARDYAQGVVETVREPLIILDAELRVVSANRSFYATFQVKPENTEHQLLYDLGNRQWDIPKLRTLLEEILPQQTSFQDFEVEHEFATIGKKTMRLNARRLAQETGRPMLILLAIEDITERKRLEEQYRGLLEAAPDAIVIADKEGHIRIVNHRTEEIFGHGRDELLGNSMESLFSGRFKEQYRDYHRKYLSNPSAMADTPLELEGIRKDGSRFPVEIMTQIQEEEEEEEEFLLMTLIRDITERKRLEEEQGLVNRGLETLVHVISHDLKEPLRAIEGFSMSLRDQHAERLDEKGLDYAQRIVKASARLRLLLEDLVTMSRARLLTPQKEPVEGREVVEKALARLTTKIEETKAKIQIAEGLPRLQADVTWTTQAVYNLLLNALKFTREGVAPEVEIAPYVPGLSDPRGVGLVIRDRGPGVPPEHVQRIFELFQRAVGHEVEGTGAGLAITSEIARRHGGSAWVQPREGGGSEFIITLGRAQP